MMMLQCWESVPDKRPSFKTLYTNSSTMIEGMTCYLEMQFNPFTTEKPAGEGEDVKGEETVDWGQQ